MVLSFIIWIVFHNAFLTLGIEQHSYTMMLIMYGIRGFAYPMFIYSFVVWITYSAPRHRLASAMGWFWAMYSVGIGFLGTYLPSFTIPWIGFMGNIMVINCFYFNRGLNGDVLSQRKKAKTKKQTN